MLFVHQKFRNIFTLEKLEKKIVVPFDLAESLVILGKLEFFFFLVRKKKLGNLRKKTSGALSPLGLVRTFHLVESLVILEKKKSK